MSGSNKIRINSQIHTNSRPKHSLRRQSALRAIQKAPSLNSDTSSPLRLTQKFGQSPYRKPIPLLKHNESDFLNEQRSPLLSEDKILLLQKKISQHKLKELPQPKSKIQRSNPYLLNSKLSNEDVIPRVKLEPTKKAKPKKHLWYFTKGNNHQLLQQIFIDQYNFAETAVRDSATICWLQAINQKDMIFGSSKSMYDDRLPQIGKIKHQTTPTIYNYLEGQSELTNKEKLFKNMRKFYPHSIGTYIPKSFIIDFRQDEHLVQESLLQFMSYYFKKDHNKKVRNKNVVIKNYFVDINISQKTLNRMIERSALASTNQEEKNKVQVPQKGQIQQTQETLWLLKPTYLNRGRGIHVFSTLKQLSKLLSQTAFEISIKMYNDSFKPKAYIIQEYIQRPLLIEGYKFDMRFWVLLQVIKSNGKKQLKSYLFQEGYSRLASIKFESESPQKVEDNSEGKAKKDKKSYINNRFIHLTNNAVQKDAKQYGQYYQGNQLSLDDTVKYIKSKDPTSAFTKASLIQKVKQIVTDSVSTVKDRMVTSNLSKTFQLLGYDFLLDQSYNTWFIEVNCNPCLEQSSALVSGLLKKMLSGLLYLTNLQEGKGPDNAEGWSTLM